MRKIIFCLFLSGFVSFSFAQESILKGRITDTLEKKNLQNAVVALLNNSDSTLYKFSRSSASGSFNVKNIVPGKYVLLITYPGYVDFADIIDISGETDMGDVPLILKSALLETVMIRQNIAIRMKGDTIEYKADSFKVQEGASVKDLLRKLPGLQIDKDGQVTAQGQKVERVLVDGEEFFSDDPAVVIENLRADAIDKVQSYDKKSDQAEFTGIDDGSRSKTLNLVLKEDRKRGLLGKMVVSGGTSERYSEEAMLNYFKGKKKVSVYGIASNTGKTGLGWEDRSTFGGGNDFGDAEVNIGSGFIMITGGGDDDFSDWGNMHYDEGIPSTIKAGAHYSNKWNDDKHHVNSNYSIKDMRLKGIGSSLTKYILPDSAYYSKESHVNNSTRTDQILTAIYDMKLDSASSIKIRLNGKLDRNTSNSFSTTESDNEELIPVNRNTRNTNIDKEGKIFLGSALWRQKLRKTGRTLSLFVSHKVSDYNSNGYLVSHTDYFDLSGNPFQTDTLDQFKTSLTKTITTSSRLVYTEPMGKKSMIEFNYAFNRTNSLSDRKSFDKLNGKYEVLNDVFSNRYGLVYLSNSAGAKFQYNSRKLVANIGSNVGVANYEQNDSTGKEVRNFRYVNLFPTARINYKIAPQRSVNFSYSGTPQPPGIDQIQPLAENTNPLFIKVGNPHLKQSFRHNFSLFYNDFKTLSGRSIWMNGSVTAVQDAIVTSQVTNAGITTQQYINTRGNYNYWMYLSYGFKLKKPEMNVGISINSSGGRYVNFVNGLRNESNNNAIGLRINGNIYKDEKYNMHFNSGFNYNHSVSSINPVKNNFMTQEHNVHLSYFISKKLQIGTDANFYIREKVEAFSGNNNITVWDASISYKIFKKNNGVIKLEINDILEQRSGYDRRFTSNYIYERNYNMLSRYALLSFTWNFSKNPATTE